MSTGGTFATVDLKGLIHMDKRARGFVRTIRAIGRMHDALLLTLCTLPPAEQRFLMQILAWRMEGGTMLTATQGLVHMPLLVGMGFDEIKDAADSLVESGIIEFIATKTDDEGNPKAGGFRWPDLDRLLHEALQQDEQAPPAIVGTDGRALR